MVTLCMVEFAYKLQLHYNIYTLIDPIWMEISHSVNKLNMKITPQEFKNNTHKA